MKTLEIRIQSDGVVRRKISDEVFDGENDTLAVTIDFSLTDYSDWEKRCEVVVENGAKGIKLGDSFLLGSEYLKKGATLLQPMATKGDLVVKFPVIKIAVARSLNVLEGDTSVTLSVAEEVLQDIELFKIDVNGKLALQDIKIDDFQEELTTSLAAQDNAIASNQVVALQEIDRRSSLQDTSISNRLGSQDTTIATNRIDILAEVDRRTTLQDSELVSQNIKIDGLVLDTDTRLSEQDTTIASNHTATLVEVDRRATIQDAKIDDKVAQIDSQLSEQDILVADLELKLAQSEAKVSELMAMNNDKTWGRFA